LWQHLEPAVARSVVHALDRELLRRRDLELEAVYRADRIRDEARAFPTMVQAALGEMLRVAPGEFAVLALYGADRSAAGLELHLQAAPGRRQSTVEFLNVHRERLLETVHRSLDGSTAPRELSGRAIVWLPISQGQGAFGALVMVAPAEAAFSDFERRLVEGIWTQVDTAVLAHRAAAQLRQTFRRHVSGDIADELLQKPSRGVSGRRAEVTCLFSDLRGFTTVSEQLDVDTIVRMLNEHLAAMTEIVFDNGGTVDKFIGDCVMAIFGAPVHQPDHALRAVTCAFHMRARQQALAQQWAREGLPPVKIGIGMTTGTVFAGTIGGDELASYTVIGDTVNLAARLEGESGPDDIILSEATLQQVRAFTEVESRGAITVKGKSVATPIYNLLRVVPGE
jgi:class 3 adenylate cyclase